MWERRRGPGGSRGEARDTGVISNDLKSESGGDALLVIVSTSAKHNEQAINRFRASLKTHAKAQSRQRFFPSRRLCVLRATLQIVTGNALRKRRVDHFS
jgi:hypothetical protein